MCISACRSLLARRLLAPLVLGPLLACSPAAPAATADDEPPAAAPGSQPPSGGEAIAVAAPDDRVDVRAATVIAEAPTAAAPGSACNATGDASLVELRDGKLRLPETIRYRVGKAQIHERSLQLLDAVAASLCARSSLVVEIGVHTDSAGSSAYNRALSQKRAEMVRDYLLDKGLAPNRLRAVGYGEDRPITHASRAELRRTEFVVVSR